MTGLFATTARPRERARIGSLIRCGSAEVHVREDGPRDGPAVVLLHGFSSSMHSFDLVTPLLAQTCRVVRIDLLGHGCTGGDGDLDVAPQANMVASVLEALDVTGATVLGHSFGADVAVATVSGSDRADRLVIVAQAPDYSYAKLPRAGAILALPFAGTVLHRLSTPPVVRLLTRFAFAPGFDAGAALGDRDRMYRDHAAMSPAMYRTTVLDRRKWLAAHPLDAQIREHGLPSLAILGRQDQLYDCEKTVARYRAAGARVAVVEGSGHSPPIEQPAETAELIRAFATG